MQRAVFLDRDNTIIHNDGDLGDPQKVELIKGAASAIASLRGLGYRIVVISNQGGVARGLYTEQDVEAVNQRIAELVRQQSGATIDRFYFCPYHPDGTVEQYRRDHPWRKPQAGMLLQAVKDLNLDLERSWTVGDQLRDIEAGKAAGTHTVLLTQQAEPPTGPVNPDFAAASLIEAVRIIAQQPLAPEVEHASAGDPSHTAPRRIHKPARPEKPAEPAAHPRETSLWQAGVSVQTLSPPEEAPPEPNPALHAEAQAPAAAMDEPEPPPAAAPEPPPPAGKPQESGRQVELLGQILRELKHQRVDVEDFSWSRMAAVLVQMVTAGCVLFALFSTGSEAFYQWMLGAVVGQLAVIAALLFTRS